MIKQTFINLSEEKKKQIIEAAKKEFAEKPLHEASINKIIKELGLARGSFYNYFDNIEDLYFYILQDFKMNIKNKLFNGIKNNKGDIFKAYEEVFNYVINFDKNKVDKSIMKNLFLNFNSNNQVFMTPKPNCEEMKEKFSEMYAITDKTKLKINDEESFITLLEILKDNMFQNIIYYFMFNLPKEKIRQKYINKEKIIKYGILKEEENCLN